MSSTIRQFENAVGILVDGMLRESDNGPDSHQLEEVAALVQTLRRVAGQWAENLERSENPETQVIQVTWDDFVGKMRPYTIELIRRALQADDDSDRYKLELMALDMAYADLMGEPAKIEA